MAARSRRKAAVMSAMFSPMVAECTHTNGLTVHFVHVVEQTARSGHLVILKTKVVLSSILLSNIVEGDEFTKLARKLDETFSKLGDIQLVLGC